MKRESKVLLGAGLIVIAVLGICLLLVLLGPGLAAKLFTEGIADKYPQVFEKPVERTVGEFPPDPSRARTAFGYAFELPFEPASERTEDGTLVFESGDGRRVVFPDPADSIDMRESVTGDSPENEAAAREMLGEEMLRSSYAFEKAVLEFTPDDDPAVFGGRDQAVRVMLVGLKTLLVIGAETGMYAFETDALRGFQLGDPDRSDLLTVRVFDAKDRKIEILFIQADAAVRYTQEDVDRVLGTLRPAD